MDKKYRAENPEKRRAQIIVQNHKIKPKSNCEICGVTGKLDRHHPDYDKPLLTVTLCRKCHMNLHKCERNHKVEIKLDSEIKTKKDAEKRATEVLEENNG